LTDELRLALAQCKPELLSVLAGEWFTAAGALLVRYVGKIPSSDWWNLDESFARRVEGLLVHGVDRRKAERLAYLELAETLDEVRTGLHPVGDE
jgi:hypothetical protein